MKPSSFQQTACFLSDWRPDKVFGRFILQAAIVFEHTFACIVLIGRHSRFAARRHLRFNKSDEHHCRYNALFWRLPFSLGQTVSGYRLSSSGWFHRQEKCEWTLTHIPLLFVKQGMKHVSPRHRASFQYRSSPVSDHFSTKHAVLFLHASSNHLSMFPPYALHASSMQNQHKQIAFFG